jgi:hypothetical protein
LATEDWPVNRWSLSVIAILRQQSPEQDASVLYSFDDRYRSGIIANRAYGHVFSIHREIEADDGSRKT